MWLATGGWVAGRWLVASHHSLATSHQKFNHQVASHQDGSWLGASHCHWWLVTRGWWLVVGGWWLVARGWLLVARGWWLVADSLWLGFYIWNHFKIESEKKYSVSLFVCLFVWDQKSDSFSREIPYNCICDQFEIKNGINFYGKLPIISFVITDIEGFPLKLRWSQMKLIFKGISFIFICFDGHKGFSFKFAGITLILFLQKKFRG